jgi:hypothetical protein
LLSHPAASVPGPPLDPAAPGPLLPQLCINLVALIVAFVAAISNGETPLNVLQLLWVNLIMDSLAALGETAGPGLGSRHTPGWAAAAVHHLSRSCHSPQRVQLCEQWDILAACWYESFWLGCVHTPMRAALATEAPTPDLLTKKPHGRDEPLISKYMWRFIGSQVCYQVRCEEVFAC